jgi:hypothetical protein
VNKKQETILDKKIRLTKECRDGKWTKLSSGKYSNEDDEPACALCEWILLCESCPLYEYLRVDCLISGSPYQIWGDRALRAGQPDFNAPEAVAAAKKMRDALTGTLKMLRKQKRDKVKKGGRE